MTIALGEAGSPQGGSDFADRHTLELRATPAREIFVSHKKTLFFASCVCLCIAAGSAWAQKASGKSPAAADNGPSLEVTLKFIADKLNSLGEVRFASQEQQDGVNFPPSLNSYTYTDAAASPQNCAVSFQFKAAFGPGLSTTVPPRTNTFDFGKKFRSYVVETAAVSMYSTKAIVVDDPKTWRINGIYTDAYFATVKAYAVKNGQSFAPDREPGMIFLQDEELANRLVKAMNHAAELCQGPAPKEPF